MEVKIKKAELITDKEIIFNIYSRVWRKYSNLPPIAGLCALGDDAVKDIEFFGRVCRSRFSEIIPESVMVYAVPYLRKIPGERRNMARFAVFPDYHVFMARLGEELCSELRGAFPQNRFAAFCDNSPLREVYCAVCAGLGKRGKNNLLITELYGTYVFIGEIICGFKFNDFPVSTQNGEEKPRTCENCGKCIKVCPSGALGGAFQSENCLSALTQAKHINPVQEKLIFKNSSVWGCDKCAECCPYNDPERIIYSDIDFFSLNRIPYLDSVSLENLNGSEFMGRTYGWRGINVIKRNVELLGEK